MKTFYNHLKTITFFVIFLISFTFTYADILQSVTSGPFNAAATWNPAQLPATGDTIIVNNSHTVTINGYNSPVLGPITIQSLGNITIVNNAVASLNFDGNLTVNGTLINNGRIDLINPANFVLGPGATYDHNPRINIAADESVFENGIENFSPTSTLIIRKWASAAQPLRGSTRVTGDIGNLVTSVTGTPWEQRGRFSPNRIKGDLTVLDGVIRMDDGSGLTTKLVLNNVTLRGTSAIIFQEGNNRNDTLICQNFTDSSTLVGQPTIIMNGSLGVLNWTVNGNFITTHDFIAVYDSTFPVRTASAFVNITGNMTICGNGNRFDFMKQVNGPLTLIVGGTTTISNNPSYVRFIDSGTGALNFTTSNFVVSAGLKNVLLGGNEFVDASNNPLFPLPTGVANINITTDFTVSGTTNTTLMLSTADVNKTRLVVGRDFLIGSTTANVVLAKSIGPVTCIVGRNVALTGGNLDVQNFNSSNALDSVDIANSFTFNSTLATNYFRANSGAGNTVIRIGGNFNLVNSGTGAAQGISLTYLNNGNLDFYVAGNFVQNAGAFYGIQEGTGNNIFKVDGSLTITGGIFKGTSTVNAVSAGKCKFILGAIDFTGGNFVQYNAANDSVQCTVATNINVNYASVADFFSFIPYVNPVYSNVSPLALTVAGNVTFGGANGTFYSSVTQGNEVINITGNLQFNNGNNSFNLFPNSAISSSHVVTMTIGGNIGTAGGNNYLSAGRGDFTGTVNGNLNISGGTLSVKGNAADVSVVLNVKGGYTQTNGTFYFHNNTSIAPSLTTVTINSDDDNVGNFVQSGGIIYLVNNTLSSADVKLAIKSPNYTIGPNGIIQRDGVGTTNARGSIDFSRTGTTLFTRINGHSVKHCVQTIFGVTTLEVISGDLQIGTYLEEFAGQNLPMLDVKTNGTLTLRNNSQVYSDALDPKTVVVINSNAKMRLQHTSGLYNGTGVAALNAYGNMNYILLATSTIEYFGDDNQMVTGIGVGTATSGNQKYGILDINFGGDPLVEYVYPTNIGTVNVRNILKLTQGQLRLDDDNNPVSGGRSIYIENSPNTSITRVAGYIRAETYDGLSIVKWNMGSALTAHVIPFGIDASTYIPVTITPVTATAGDVSVSTYKTSATNTPYPPAVGHVNSAATGTDNSANCVKRFWKINRTGTSTNFNVIFSAPASEFPASAGPYKAQHYNYVGGFWDNPFQGVQSYNSVPAVRTVTANTLANTNDWWVLVNQNNPLPVELLSFNTSCVNSRNTLRWTTASELNNDFFQIEKSNNGIDFILWKQVKGNGTTNTISNYEVVDEVNSNSNFYRLKQIDFNGKIHELKTIFALRCDNEFFDVLSVSSVAEKINGFIASPENIAANLTIIDVNGKLVYQKPIELNVGINSFEFPSTLANGVYYLQVSNGMQYISGKKFILNH